VGDLIMNKFGDLGMVMSIVHHPSADLLMYSAYVDWFKYEKYVKTNISMSKVKEYRENLLFYIANEQRAGRWNK
jgi:hypothetical protein